MKGIFSVSSPSCQPSLVDVQKMKGLLVINQTGLIAPKWDVLHLFTFHLLIAPKWDVLHLFTQSYPLPTSLLQIHFTLSLSSQKTHTFTHSHTFSLYCIFKLSLSKLQWLDNLLLLEHLGLLGFKNQSITYRYDF